VERCPGENGFSVSWRTDEPTTGRIEYGETEELGEEIPITEAGTHHTVSLPPEARHFQIVAIDRHGDETLADLDEDPYPVCEPA